MVLDTGSEIGDYRILSRIGRGTCGIVFEAEHMLTQRVDALKLLLDAHCPTDEEQRFLREIQLQASLQHPNIATVYSAFRSPCGLVLVMERIHGQSLRAILERGRLPLEKGMRYVLDTLAGLECAERAGVIHRDIKPENILITPDGKVKLTDFGLAHSRNSARITGSGESLGTPMYMAPEQIDGLGQVDARTDVYSVGVVLYELVTGRLPFPGTNGYAIMRAHRETPPPPPAGFNPAIGPRLNAAILKALAKDQADRFQNAAAFRAALEKAVAPEKPSRRSGKFSFGRMAAAILIGIGICGATLAIGRVYLWKRIVELIPAAQADVAAPAAAGAASTPESQRASGEAHRQSRATAVSSAMREPLRGDSHPAKPVARKNRASQLPPNAYAVEGVIRLPGPNSSQAAEPEPETAVEAAPETPVKAAAPAEPAEAEFTKAAPAASTPAATAAEPKKRNVVVRTFKKLFHGRNSGEPADASTAGAKPKPGQ